MKTLTKLRVGWLALIASIAALVLVVTHGSGLSPVDLSHSLSCCVDWLEAFTGHTDGIMMIAGGAVPAIPKVLQEKIDKLIKAQDEQHGVIEKEIQKHLKDHKGIAELTEKMEKANGDVAGLIDDINSMSTKLAKESQEREELIQKLNTRLDKTEKFFDPDGNPKSVGQTPGQLFLASDAYKEASDRRLREVGKVDINLFPLRAFKNMANVTMSEEMRKLLTINKSMSTAAASAGALADPLRLPGVITEPNISLNVQDLIPTTVIQEGSVDWVREDEDNSTVEGGADVVAETTASDSLVPKPEVDIVFTLQEETMRTIAAWIAASKQILSDSRRVQLESYIDGRLMYAVDLELEDQLLLGDGTGQNLEGLVPNAVDYNQGFATIQGASPTKIDTLRRAKTQARLAEYPVTGYVLHPQDWQDIELTKGTDLHYIWANPAVMLAPRLWGVPVADSTRMTAGEFLVGAFSLGCELFTKGDATIEIARQHGEFFTANMVAILAEMRALLAIYRPKAFVAGSFAGSGSGSGS